MVNVIERAKELGLCIAKSDEYLCLVEREKLLLNDQDSVALLKDYDTEKAKLSGYQNFGIPVPPEKLKKVEELRDLIQNNKAIRELLEAQKQYEALLKKVNEEINHAIEEVSKNPNI